MKDGAEQFLSIKEVLGVLGLKSRTTLWRMVQEKRLPTPLRISAGRVAWPQSDIVQYQKKLLEARAIDPSAD